MSALDDEVRDTTAQGRPGNDADWAVLHTRLGNVAMASRPLDGAAFSKDDGKGRGGGNGGKVRHRRRGSPQLLPVRAAGNANRYGTVEIPMLLFGAGESLNGGPQPAMYPTFARLVRGSAKTQPLPLLERKWKAFRETGLHSAIPWSLARLRLDSCIGALAWPPAERE